MQYPNTVPAELQNAINNSAQAYNIPSSWLVAIWRRESNSTYPNPYVNSHGYGGLFGTKNWDASTQNQADEAASVLTNAIRAKKGNISLALSSYSGGGYSSLAGINSGMPTTSPTSSSVANTLSTQSGAGALTPDQITNANLIWTAAHQAGLNDNQAYEMIGASYAESGLDENAVNKSSGALGLFQLLSSGYVNTYNSLVQKGVPPAQANIQAILPSYVTAFRQNQGSAPGTVAALVESSGEPPSWYAGGITGFLGALKGSGFSGVSNFAGASSSPLGGFPGGGYITSAASGTYSGSGLKSVVDAGESAVQTTESVGHFLGKLTDPNFWIRALEIVGGMALVGLGLYLIAKDIGGAMGASLPSPSSLPGIGGPAKEVEDAAQAMEAAKAAQASHRQSMREAQLSAASERAKQAKANTSRARANARAAREGAREAQRRAERARGITRSDISQLQMLQGGG
jgi:hypothetical protein